ncbi:MAG: DUF523 domain-containing protein [Firmicutes bacterium]|nr:DUF523 domain-containing protein [Bacillota bacterium]
MILVSACLLGLHTRYDQGTCHNQELIDLLRQGLVIPVCPEQLGGLPTPRPCSEIKGGSGPDVLAGRAMVQSREGDDFTEQYIRGAQEALYLAQLLKTPAAILKAHSPACGSKKIYDGSHKRVLRPGVGVLAALLRENGITVYSEEDLNPGLLKKLASSLAGRE